MHHTVATMPGAHIKPEMKNEGEEKTPSLSAKRSFEATSLRSEDRDTTPARIKTEEDEEEEDSEEQLRQGDFQDEGAPLLLPQTLSAVDRNNR